MLEDLKQLLKLGTELEFPGVLYRQLNASLLATMSSLEQGQLLLIMTRME